MDSGTRWIFVTVLLLILPPESQSENVKTTCEIPSVESGDNATLTIRFGHDLTHEESIHFIVTHLAHNATVPQEMLSCYFTKGNVTCDKTSCCTWESQVADVFRVYIHNVSQELKGKFWGFVIPADKTEQKYCNFTLKASTCSADSINMTNTQVICSNHSIFSGQSCTVTCSPGFQFQENLTFVTYTCIGKNKWSQEMPAISCEASTCSADSINITNSQVICSNHSIFSGQSCTVTCSPGFQFQENLTFVTYTCIGKNKWSQEMPAISCEAFSCPTDSINATNSHMTCSNQSVTIGQTCTVTCSPGHYFQENHNSVTYTCVGKSKWSPENNTTHCKEQAEGQKRSYLYPLLLLLLLIPIVFVIFFFCCRKRQIRRKRRRKHALEKRKRKDRFTFIELNKRQTPLERAQKEMTNYWLECIRNWYPELQSRTYFLPPLPSNYGQSSPQTSQDCDGRDDKALKRVLLSLRALADNPQDTDTPQDIDNPQETDKLQQPGNPQSKEVMMVISQLPFGKYIDQPSYAGALALLPTYIIQSELFQKHYDKGDCDVLIIHKTLELLTLQITSVGENFSQQEMTEQEQDDVVVKKVKEAVKHLKKATAVLKHLTSDIVDIKHITEILVLPNISSSQLLRAINRFPSDGQLLCKCLGAKSVRDAVKLCLLKDQLSDNQKSSDINHSSLQALREWWQHVRASRSGSSLTSSSLYKQLVTRFCGPATTVEVHCVTAPRLNIRTLGEAVSETGERVARLVLFPQQVDILNQSLPRAFLSGPPGTGKTIVLIMQGLTWIQRGYDVHVVSTCDESRAVTFVIEHQLQETAKTSTARSRVHRHQFDFLKDGEVKTAVRRLKSQSEGRQLCVIADEVVRDDRKSFTEFCYQLIIEVSGVFIWGASLYHDAIPSCLEEVKLTTPLRSPPVVVREVMKALEIKDKEVHNYTFNDVPVLKDGPPVMRIKHRDGQLGHTGNWLCECVECGHEVARVLRKLNVGRTGNINGPPPLQYRDVLVVCYDYPTDDRVDNGQVTKTACCLVRGLRDSHVPVRVEDGGDEAAIRDTALGVSDQVTVANWKYVRGLERKVVVVESGLDLFVRLHAMSRCTSQLVTVSTRMTNRFRHHSE